MEDTIFALATARGKSGVAVVRISGDGAHEAVARLCGDVPEPRRASLRQLRSRDGGILDEALVLIFPSGASFTGERVAELQLHGSIAVVRAVLRELGRLPCLRHAEPGEFTRRALANGRLDLTQVEGLADLVDAETEAQRRMASRTLSGALGRKAEAWRQQLTETAALVEATIDFSDEDLPEDLAGRIAGRLDALLVEWREEVDGVRAAELVRDGFEVAIVGPPNTGKSTLLNRIAGRDIAITSALAGTTRDVLEVRLDLDGLAVTLLDTAGLRESQDEIEAIGVARSRTRAEAADLRVFLSTSEEDRQDLLRAGDLVVQGKADLGPKGDLGVSGLTGEGISNVLMAIATELGARVPANATATHARHAEALGSAIHDVRAARDLVVGEGHTDLAADHLRSALHRMDVLVGRVDVEDILGHIFANFCIGK